LAGRRVLAMVVVGMLGVLMMPAVAGAAVREAHYSGGGGTAGSSLDIAAADAVYDDAGTLTLSMRFVQPAPNPLPAGTVLRWTVSSSRNSDAVSCPATRTGDVNAVVTTSPAAPTTYRLVGRRDSSGDPIVKPFALSFSADRRTATATISDTGIADRDYRCIEATSDIPAEADGFDTTDRVPFGLPLDKLAVKRGLSPRKSSKRPGHTILKIGATDGAKITIKVKRRGGLVYSRRFTAEEGFPFRKRFNWSCNKTGVFRYAVQASDTYGKKLTRKGRWKVSSRRCARLRAAERHAAEERAAKRHAEREEQENDDGGGGGGGGCASGYSPCLPITGDLDCDEIPDSSKPVQVYGDDPYGLDSDNDGLGCES